MPLANDTTLDKYCQIWANLYKCAKIWTVSSPSEAFDLGSKLGKDVNNVAILITGSLHLVGEALRYLDECHDPPHDLRPASRSGPAEPEAWTNRKREPTVIS